MRILIFGTIATISVGLWSCKTVHNDGAGLKDASTDNTALLADIKASLKEGGCLGCHANTGEADWKQWSIDTKDTFERLTSQEADNDFDPTTFVTKGVYKAYPEYYKKFFTDDNAYEDFADNLRPDPGMRVRGTGTLQQQRFLKIRDNMLKLADSTAANSSLGCTTKISPEYKQHIVDAETNGWSARLLTGANGSFKSFGCQAGSVNPLKCFADRGKFPTEASYVADKASSGHNIIRVANVGSTYYWTRSSPDGRYVGNGAQNSSKAHIDDLQNHIRYYMANKRYDPGFFPDNNGFSFHGNPAIFCSIKALDPNFAEGAAGTTTVGGETWKTYLIDSSDKAAGKAGQFCHVDGQDPLQSNNGTGSQNIATYQSVASAEGSKAYVVTGSHSTDIGSIRQDNVSFAGELLVYEMTRTSDGYKRVSDSPTTFNLPNEGDYSLTPSAQYLVGRVAGKSANGSSSVQLGYRLRSLSNMLAQGSSFKPETDPTMSSICLSGSGSKPMVSLDERFMAFHQYEGDSSNIYLVDLLKDGKVYKVTNLPAGKRALFAHFRADGWLYFLLADGTTSSSADAYIMASDLAIRIAEEN